MLSPSPVILRLAGRTINRRFLQSLLFVIGVALGVAVVIAIDVANGSASRAFSLSTASVAGEATHQVVGGPAGLPTDIFRQIRVDLGVRESAPVIEEYVRAGGNTEGELGQPLRLLGVDIFSEAPFRGYLNNIAVSEDNPGEDAFNAITDFLARPGSVIISGTLADRLGLAAGDSMTLRTGTRAVEVQIVGLIRASDGVSEQAIDDLVLSDIATAQEVVGRPDAITRVDLILPEATADATLEQIRTILPQGARAGAISENNTTLDQMTAAFNLNLQALSLLALVVGVFLIYNTVTFSVVQRRPVIGILRSLGATRRQIFSLILSEALLLGLIGTILGLGLGLIFGRASVRVVAQTINDLFFTVNVQRVSVEPITLLKGAAVGLFASLGAAVIPSLDATRTPPAGTMRRSDQESATRRLVPLITVAAVTLNIIGLLLLQLPTNSLYISFGALFCIVVGSAFFTPVVLIGAMRLFTPITERLFGVLGRMAPRAVARSLSRTSVAVAALTVAVSVIVGVSVMIASFRNTVAAWLGETLGGDIYISPPLLTANRATVDVDPSVVDVVASVEGVRLVSTSRDVSVTALDYPNIDSSPNLPPVNLQAADFDIATDRRFAWLNVPPEFADYRAALEGGKVIVTEPFAFRRGITPEANTITLLTDNGPQTFEVVGVYYDYSTDQGKVFMYRTTYQQFYDDPYISSLAAYVEEGADINTVINTLRTDALSGYDLLVQSNRDLRSGVFVVFDNAFAITIALRLLATVVAFIGILSALLSLQLENTRQYGVMRATGMTPRQLWNFTLLQTGLMGTVAGALALPIGLALALVLLYVINVRSFGWTMDFYPVPEEFVQAFAVAVIAALLAGVYPALRLTRLITARALRSE
ncbi:MAG: FtsX-like permease family protein [bacterium]|nr:FtsX-like permease family protein [bacterium]